MARDACSLVDAFRSGELSPLEALDACIAAIEASPLNAFSSHRLRTGRAAAAPADVSLPFGGVPFGIKELEKVAGVALHGGIGHLPGPVPGTTTRRSSGSACDRRRPGRADDGPRIRRHQLHLHRAARDHAEPLEPRAHAGRFVRRDGGGGGGGLLPIATGSDGGGSIRGPAGFSGLFGLKATYGRIPKGPDGDASNR